MGVGGVGTYGVGLSDPRQRRGLNIGEAPKGLLRRVDSLGDLGFASPWGMLFYSGFGALAGMTMGGEIHFCGSTAKKLVACC